jgi:tricorn protease
MFTEAWRLLLNGFYDPEFHGVDWAAIRDKYEPLAMAAYTEEEFRAVVREMLGELSASHLGIYKWGGGGVSTGRLGVYHDERYDGPGVLVRKVIPDSPAERERIVAGDYILSIAGHEIAPGENYHKLLEDTAADEILIEVASSAGGRDRREVRIRPVGSVRTLVYEDRVRQRREKVERLSGGRLGYLHIAGMGTGNLFQFEEDLFAQGKDKDGLIVDIRGNGGGSVHDGILRYLDRRVYGYTMSRGRPPSYNPLELYTMPLALVIDESCYSADLRRGDRYERRAAHRRHHVPCARLGLVRPHREEPGELGHRARCQGRRGAGGIVGRRRRAARARGRRADETARLGAVADGGQSDG